MMIGTLFKNSRLSKAGLPCPEIPVNGDSTPPILDPKYRAYDVLLTSRNPTPSSFNANAASHHLIRRHPLVDGDVKIDGLDIVWSMSVSNRIFPNNHWADGSRRVKPTIDAAPAELVDLTVTEVTTAGIDGESLIVNFDVLLRQLQTP